MKTNIYTHNPEFKVFLKFWLLIFSFFLLLLTIFYFIINDGEPFQDHLKTNALMLLLLPVINSIINTYGARKHSFTISDVDDTGHVASWAIDLLQKNGMKVKTEHQNQTILEPANGISKWFGNKFDTELVSVEATADHVAIIGKYKYIDIIDTKIKFGKPTFKKA